MDSQSEELNNKDAHGNRAAEKEEMVLILRQEHLQRY